MIDELRLDKTVQMGVAEDAWSAFLWPMRGVPAKKVSMFVEHVDNDNSVLLNRVQSC